MLGAQLQGKGKDEGEETKRAAEDGGDGEVRGDKEVEGD